jgi:hypothetical protein
MGINKPYSKLQTVEMPQSVQALFSVRIERARTRARRFHSIRYGAYTAISMGVCIVSAVSVSSALSQSGAYQFVSLVFNDSAALSYSREIFLSVLESLPVLGVASLLGTLFFSGITLPRFIQGQSSPLHM